MSAIYKWTIDLQMFLSQTVNNHNASSPLIGNYEGYN